MFENGAILVLKEVVESFLYDEISVGVTTDRLEAFFRAYDFEDNGGEVSLEQLRFRRTPLREGFVE